ncbi:(2Fe-2S)-binding protein [Streptomyces sp. J2-1]|uniref:(2Fe-2S)-binding protein n=1 Tax=Streptomyces corallincola TaxID=2851888 RepID=UPI001C383675|nr:(2Fe-2S)-binding protein [Streptomyces corallincola]MBV2356308.1 (2Fe-2S)-binding protein [Streptomyces corallincola]
MSVDPDLSVLRPLGGFFVLRTGTAAPDDAEAPTLADAYRPGAEDDVLARRLHVVATRLRVGEPRVCASLAQQGLAARLWSVALGCAAVHGTVPDLDPALLRWDPEAGAPDDLLLTEVRPHPEPGGADAVADTVLHAHLAPLTATLRARYGVASGLLWGNAASALAGAARELDRWARAHGRTEVAQRAADLTGRLLAHPLLRGTGTRSGTAFRRRSCCLYYRVPGGGVCGDCCFVRPPRPSPGAASG